MIVVLRMPTEAPILPFLAILAVKVRNCAISVVKLIYGQNKALSAPFRGRGQKRGLGWLGGPVVDELLDFVVGDHRDIVQLVLVRGHVYALPVAGELLKA